MSVAPEHDVLCAVARGGEKALRAALRLGVEEGWFVREPYRGAWQLVLDFSRRHRGRPPTKDELSQMVPSLHLELDRGLSLEEAVEGLRRQVLMQHLDEMAGELARRRFDPDEALQYLRSKLDDLRGRYRGPKAAVFSNYIEAGWVEDLRKRREATRSSLFFPWPTVQMETGGLRKGALTVLFGRPKSMKTFVALWYAIHNYLEGDARVLIFSRELPREELYFRIAAILARLDYRDWMLGAVDDAEVNRKLRSIVQEKTKKQGRIQPELHPDICVVDQEGLEGMRLEDVGAYIEDFKPDIVLDDSIYLAGADIGDGESFDWRRQYKTARTAKVLAQRYDVLYMATVQAKNKRDRRFKRSYLDPDEFDWGDDVAFADAYLQNCDLLVRVTKRPSFLVLGFPAFREGEIPLVFLEKRACESLDEIEATAALEAEPNRDVRQALKEKLGGDIFSGLSRVSAKVYERAEEITDVEELPDFRGHDPRLGR